MYHSILAMIGVLTMAGLGPTASPARADASILRQVTVTFGAGLNTAQPGNHINHEIIPDHILVTREGAVHFLVSGFHQIFVYNPGTDVEDVRAAIPDPLPDPPPTFINCLENLMYQGIVPAGGSPPGTPGALNPSNASNRLESVYFAEPGTCLVICNVTGHFLDGMYAYVKVLP
jgi:hypothetical protein